MVLLEGIDTYLSHEHMQRDEHIYHLQPCVHV